MADAPSTKDLNWDYISKKDSCGSVQESLGEISWPVFLLRMSVIES